MKSNIYRIDYFIYSCQNIDHVTNVLRKKFTLEQKYVKRFLKKYYIKNTFILNHSAELYFNYKTEINYVYMAFEGYFSDLEKFINLAYILYEELYEFFPLKVKLKSFLNTSNEKIDYKSFEEFIKNFFDN